MTNTTKENTPDPSRLIVGLRDTGYNFNSAAADIIDNSIAAGAENIHVRLDLKPNGAKFIYFGDDGSGMDEEGLFNAMRYGSDQRENLKSLGKFGLGLKTASSSVCRKFSLISRADPDTELGKLTWDLEHVEKVNEWQMLTEDVEPDEAAAFEDLCGETGTLVVWSKCDRVLNSNTYDPGSSKELAALKRIGRKLEDHCSLVFHKYLDSADEEHRNISISIDGRNVEHWNPFYPAKSESVLTGAMQKLSMIRPSDSSQHEARIRAWVLPHRKDMTKDEEKQFARISNGRQGFYIYREGRLIQKGNWMGIWKADDPHFSLIRVELDFNHELDEAFEINVNKSKIAFNEALAEYLEKLLQGPRNYADTVYRRKQKVSVASGISHRDSNRTIKGAKTTTPVVTATDEDKGEATVDNNRGKGIKIVGPVLNNQDPDSVSVQSVDDITSGNLWEPCFVSASETGHSTGVRINEHHDFYTKIYARAGKDSVEGMDLVLWALAAAEENNTDAELKEVWEDMREEVSKNLRKLLKDYEMPAS